LATDAADLAAAGGQFAVEAVARYDVARLGDPKSVCGRLAELAGIVRGPLVPAMAAAASALATADATALDRTTTIYTGLGQDLLAAETARAAAALHRRPNLAAAAAARASTCPTAATPLLRLARTVVGLTRRERDVAGLAAAGLTSQTIADRLRLSVRTVDNHLGRVYQKLGVTNRRELTPALRPLP
jgi:DNA-binding CsgD family transcriptional regulator